MDKPRAEGSAPGVSGSKLLESSCLGCHLPGETGLSRISQQRKTPEGWEMTLRRMQTIHGLKISNELIPTDTSAIHELVKHLADTQGLAPSETAGVRYLLEQDLNRTESFEPLLAETCGRCHSGARVALQRRTEQEWNYLIDFHLGQWPSTEYSLYGRDRPWLKIAREQVVPMLADRYAFDNLAWQRWTNSEKPRLAGKWVFTGHMPGKGYFTANMATVENEADYYNLTVNGNYLSGEAFSGTGKAVVYTGYEWRGTVTFGDITLRQVLAANPEGNTLTGRFYKKGQENLGMRITAIRDSSETQLLSVLPTHIRKGENTTLTITGTGLSGKPLFEGVKLKQILSQDSNRIVVRVSADTDADTGYASIKVGNSALDGQLAVYSRVGALDVQPAYGIARIGGNGGTTPEVETMFRAVGIDPGKDGEMGTGDDLKLGYMDAVTWETLPRDEVAAKDRDVRFAGTMDASTGIFQPAAAGPNPERYRSTNNAGNLNVQASLKEGAQTVTGIGRLLVAVQVWIDPPLK